MSFVYNFEILQNHKEYRLSAHPEDNEDIYDSIEQNAYYHGPANMVLSVNFSHKVCKAHHVPCYQENAILIEQIKPSSESSVEWLDSSIVDAASQVHQID